VGQDANDEATDLGSLESEIFFTTGLDSPNQIDPPGENRVYARSVSQNIALVNGRPDLSF
jgi:hypothetical protein